MNALMNQTAAQTMSSREIAELTGKRHDNVMTDIRNVLETLEMRPPDFLGDHKDGGGRTYQCFNLPKRETLILVSGYSIALRTKIIDRWQELETDAAKPALNPANFSRLQLIELAMQAEQERIVLEHKVEKMQPDVDAFNRIAGAEGTLCITDAAKALQVKPKALFDYLKAHSWIYKRAGAKNWVPYQAKSQAGFITAKVGTIVTHTGDEKVVEQSLITAKGLARLAKEFDTPLAA